MHWRACDWKYRAEGGRHIVVYNQAARKVLRLTKAARGTVVGLVEERAEIEKRLNYENDVIGPILAKLNVTISHPGHVVFLPSVFVAELIAVIEPHRPASRNNMVIPPGDRYAVLQADFTLRKNRQTIAMEIKPKSGVIPPSRQSCRFCLTQLQKIRRGKYDARSGYCPVDLYSPDCRRKLFALHQLIENPQNNLRLFVDGEFAYGMETRELPIKDINSTLEQICSMYGARLSYETLLSMLCHNLGSVKLSESKFCQVGYCSRMGNNSN